MKKVKCLLVDDEPLAISLLQKHVNQLDFLKMLHHPPKVIITTAYREYALDGYDLDIVDYLLKPVTFDRFFKAIERYLRTNDLAVPTAQAVLSAEAASINVKSGYKNLRINKDDIFYIESLKDYVKIVTAADTIMVKYRISDMQNELSAMGFLRIHRSFIVNLKNVSAFTASDVEVGKTELPIGESYKEQVLQILRKI